jgi:hypothetical protein
MEMHEKALRDEDLAQEYLEKKRHEVPPATTETAALDKVTEEYRHLYEKEKKHQREIEMQNKFEHEDRVNNSALHKYAT